VSHGSLGGDKSYDALNGFLRNQIELTSSNGKNGNKRTHAKNNAVIEAAAVLKNNGAREQVLDYVRSASAHQKFQVNNKNIGLSRMKITAKNKAHDKQLAAEFDTSSDAAAKNPFLHKNRELHTNSVFKSGYNAH
jgi:3-hydroxyisobutyrate dehydrogenase-like beta-hydroxyacid dehydrogenase